MKILLTDCWEIFKFVVHHSVDVLVGQQNLVRN